MTKTYWIMFRDGELWASKFLSKGFGHVYILQKDDYNWMQIHGTPETIDFCITNFCAKFDLPRLTKETHGHRCIKIVVEHAPRNFFPFHFGFLTCVSFVCLLLGIKRCIITPYRLYKFLMQLPRQKWLMGS